MSHSRPRSVRQLIDDLKAEIFKSNRAFAERYQAAQTLNTASRAGQGTPLTSYPDRPAWIPIAQAVVETIERINPERLSPTEDMLQAGIATTPSAVLGKRVALADQVFRAMMQEAPKGVDFVESLQLSREPLHPVSRRAYDYLELPLSDRSAVIDRILKISQITPEHPRVQTLMSRHTRLKRLEIDALQATTEITTNPNLEDNGLRSSRYDAEIRDLHRTKELQRRNTDHALRTLHELSQTAEPAKLIDRLAARSNIRRSDTPKHIAKPENEMD